MKRKISLLPFIVIAIILLLMNWYVMAGLSVIFPSNLWKPVFIAIILTINLSFIMALIRLAKIGIDTFFKVTVHAFMVVFVAELTFSVLVFLGSIFKLLVGFLGFNLSSGIFSVVALAFTLLLFLFFIHGMIWGKYAYRVIRQTLYFDDLPMAFDGFTLTQISDVHSGSFTNAKAVQKGIDLINAQNSDLFVFTGDLVNNKADEIVPWMAHFSQIKANYGQFSILGNHDYGDYVSWNSDLEKIENLQTLKSHHQQMGFRLLLDEHITLEKNGEKMVLAGVENWGKGFGERGDLQKALTKTDIHDFKILLSHDPSHWDEQVKTHPSKIHLTLSGHTHGMQFGIEAFGIKWSPVKYRYPHWAGLKEEFNRFLYVNRGFGFLGFSGRVGIWPEITVIELKKK
ncbi:metallophosphoesterase [Pedobacter cryophilus]|uniref:Metallophosphoesterase n=1 Tax=Pedobacter cryophilus TaxID=2571271 RepID=A0A4U1C5Y3_9SPHI|nr:metallophosphoesterase [Pedobacter cryophilus]TKC00809.1 metallophosphoesterase [Pedobacter cryophilus]